MIIHIVLLLLKIIGIVLAVLIGLVLFLLGLALFVPVRYQLKALRSEGEGEPPVRVKCRVSWLFPLFQIKFIYPSDVYLRVKILFFTVFRMPSKEGGGKSGGKVPKERKSIKKKHLVEKAEKNNAEAETTADPEMTEHAESTADPKMTAYAESTDDPGAAVHTEPTVDPEPLTDSETEDKEEKNEKSSIAERIKGIFSKIRQFIQKIQYTIESLCDKIKGIRENITYYTELIQSDTFLQAFGLCKGELISILAYISPRKLEADLVVGMGDPAATGQVLAVYGILYPLVGNHVRVTGDFEQKRIEGTLFIKGRLTLFRFVKTACRIYFNRDIRKLIKLLKKEDA